MAQYIDDAKDSSPGLQPHGESTWSRVRLEVRCADMLASTDYAMLSLEEFGFLWRLLPYAAYGGVPDDKVVLCRMGNVHPTTLKKLWPKVEPFFERVGKHWVLKDNDWVFPYVVRPERERISLRHLFRRLVDFWGRRCVYCGDTLERLAIDHIIPFSRGGADAISNLTLACRRCNSRKRDKTAAEFGHPEIHEQAARIK